MPPDPSTSQIIEGGSESSNNSPHQAPVPIVQVNVETQIVQTELTPQNLQNPQLATTQHPNVQATQLPPVSTLVSSLMGFAAVAGFFPAPDPRPFQLATPPVHPTAIGSSITNNVVAESPLRRSLAGLNGISFEVETAE